MLQELSELIRDCHERAAAAKQKVLGSNRSYWLKNTCCADRAKLRRALWDTNCKVPARQ